MIFYYLFIFYFILMRFYHLQSNKTKQKVQERQNYTTDDHGKPLNVIYDYNYIKKRLNQYDFKHTPISHLKYLDFLPIKDRSKIITKGESNTPLKIKQLKSIIKQEFDMVLPDKYLQDIKQESEIFVSKGKPISRIDLQRILEDALKKRAKNKILKFKDFKVSTSLIGQSQAEVVILY